MKRIISLIKKGIHAYIETSMKSYAWLPSGTIPPRN